MIWPLHALQVLLSVLPGTLGGQKAEEGRLGPTWPSHWLANIFLLQNSLISFSWCCLFCGGTCTHQNYLRHGNILIPDTSENIKIWLIEGSVNTITSWMHERCALLATTGWESVKVFAKRIKLYWFWKPKFWHKETSIICSLENYASFNLRRIRQLSATTMLIWPPSDFL